MYRFFLSLVLVLLFVGLLEGSEGESSLAVEGDTLDRIFFDTEVMHYTVSWSGGH